MSESGLWRPTSPTFPATRHHLHQIAFFAVSPARQSSVGRMGLRPTPGGFGTPEFDGRVARVEGATLVHEQGGNVATRHITTIRDAAVFFGGEYREVWFEGFHDPPVADDPDAPVEVVPEDTHLIGAWFAFGFGLLDELRRRASDGDDATEPQIWPEHFDAANEIGSADAGRRASYGFSPGDPNHPDPYVYVAAWGEIDRADGYWNDMAFNGASLSHRELVDSDDPASTAMRFLETGYERLRQVT